MIVVTGGSGQLGSEIQKISNSNFYFPDRSILNLEKFKSVSSFFDSNKIEAVIHAGAYTNVEQAEDQKELARKINVDATQIIAEMSNKHNYKLIYISTDYVFDGKKSSPYTELDIPNPINYYGSTKLEGEAAVIESACNPLIYRTSWVYSEYGNNFVKKIIKLSEQNEILKVIDDQVGSLTSAHDLAVVILRNMDLKGVYNFSNEGCSTWYDVAHEIVRLLKLRTKVLPVKSVDYKANAIRPHFSVLDKAKIKNELNIQIPHWVESLESCIQKIY